MTAKPAYAQEPAGSKQLPTANRPKGITAMVKGRAKKVSSGALSETYGRDFVAWWIYMQPRERQQVGDVSSMPRPTDKMDWATFTQAGGYKGAFLVVWGLMHWALYDDDRTDFVGVADDMADVFGVLAGVRRKRK